jgi:hypothetical protein
LFNQTAQPKSPLRYDFAAPFIVVHLLVTMPLVVQIRRNLHDKSSRRLIASGSITDSERWQAGARLAPCWSTTLKPHSRCSKRKPPNFAEK